MSEQAVASVELAGIIKAVEEIKNDSTQRFPDAASVRDTWRQGDVYITLINAVPAGYLKQKRPMLQIVPGTTQGSRHCLDSLDGVAMYLRKKPDMLDGPVIVTTKERVIEHPEHGNVILPAGRIYRVSYQRNLDAEEREARVMD